MCIKILRVITIAVFATALTCPNAASAVLYIRTAGSDTNNGASWTTAKRTIQAALNAAVPGDQVWVGAGTYVERLKIPEGVALYGGFPAAGGTWESRNPAVYYSVINANHAGNAISIACGAGRDTVVDGFMIRYGKSDAGAGVYCHNASPTITNNRLITNTADGFNALGGGICCENSSPLIAGNIFEGNTARFGAAIYCSNHSSPTIERNIIKANTDSSLAVIYCADYSSPVILGNIITNNSGGTHYDWYSSPIISNNTISANTGGALSFSCSSSTVANNIAAFNSWGIYRDSFSDLLPALTNNCVYSNTGYNYQGLQAGQNDINSDPLFVNRAAGDYHLAASSPCINAGANGITSTASDMDGQARVWGGTIDIGADEFQVLPSPLRDLKNLPDGSWAAVDGIVVSAAFSHFFYIETSDRLTGIRINYLNHSVSPGQSVYVTGKMNTISGERCIDAASIN